MNPFKKVRSAVSNRIKRKKNDLTSTQTTIDVRELYSQLNTVSGFSRYDMIVRYLAVEQYYGGNNYGYDLYKKMQTARVGAHWTNPSLEIFIKLIDSYKGGYNTKSHIELDKNLQLIDGSHRFALALYTNNYNISCTVRSYAHPRYIYDIKWFKVNGFTDEEINILESKNAEIAKKCLLPFTCTLWSPAQEYFEEITKHLSLWGDIVRCEDFTLDSFTHDKIVKNVYAVDDIEDWKIEMKLNKMQGGDNRKIRVVNLALPFADFRLKDKTKNTLSVTGEEIKKVIRSAYKDRIDNYFHDIIIHIGDNYFQNKYIDELFGYKDLDINVLFDNISNYQYVITKLDTPYMPSDFPNSYPLGKDVDIVCGSDKDFIEICSEITKLYSDCAPYTLRVVDKVRDKQKYHHQYRIEHNGVLIFLFDVFYLLDEFNDDFVTEMISNRLSLKNYYTPTISYELIIRLQEYNTNPKKKHHLEFIKNNIAFLEADMCNKYLNFNWNKIIQ